MVNNNKNNGYNLSARKCTWERISNPSHLSRLFLLVAHVPMTPKNRILLPSYVSVTISKRIMIRILLKNFSQKSTSCSSVRKSNKKHYTIIKIFLLIKNHCVSVSAGTGRRRYSRSGVTGNIYYKP